MSDGLTSTPLTRNQGTSWRDNRLLRSPTLRTFFHGAKDFFLRFSKLLFKTIDALFQQLYIFLCRSLKIQSARDRGLLACNRSIRNRHGD
jgi:hypothetical protein